MMQSIRNFLLTGFVLTSFNLHSQEWKRQDSSDKNLYAIYAWQTGNQYHTAYGQLYLFKDGRYKYFSYYPFSDKDSSEGKYNIKHGTLVLNSDFQINALPIKIGFRESTSTRISLPKNLNGDTCFTCSYLFNNDSTVFYPTNILKGEVPEEIHSLKIRFLLNDFTSDWTLINSTNNEIEVILLTDKNFDEYRNKIFTNYKFKIDKNKLIEISKN